MPKDSGKGDSVPSEIGVEIPNIDDSPSVRRSDTVKDASSQESSVNVGSKSIKRLISDLFGTSSTTHQPIIDSLRSVSNVGTKSVKNIHEPSSGRVQSSIQSIVRVVGTENDVRNTDDEDRPK